mgnify:CR=1 FL=1
MNHARSDARVFIGSSSESKEIAEYLQLALDPYFETTIWDQGIFTLSSPGLSALLKATNNFDFAVLIYAADDVTNKRSLEKAAPRDNVIFESGLFMGALGADRTYLVHCTSDDLHVPSDLSGITFAPFRRRRDGNLQAAVTPVAVKIREAIRSLGAREKHSPLPVSDVEVMAPIPHTLLALRHLADSSRSIARGFCGISPRCHDPKAIGKWSANVIGMLWDIFSKRQDDVYVAWLRPINTKPEIRVFLQKNLKTPKSHYSFSLGEGLAGMVWREGGTAATSHLRQHKWWVFREGCENMSYICSSIGEKGGNGGILAVGSNKGFDVTSGDEEIVAAFASFLEIAVTASEGEDVTNGKHQTPNPAVQVTLRNKAAQRP